MVYNFNLKTILIAVAVILAVAAGVYVKHLQTQLAIAQQTMQGKEALAKDLQAQVTIKGNQLVEKQRDIDGLVQYKQKYIASEAKLSITVKENEELKKKIPGYIKESEKLGSDLAAIQEQMKHAKTPEEYKKLQDQAKKIQDSLDAVDAKLQAAYAKLQELNVYAPDAGFTLKLGGGVILSDMLRPELDLKFVFFDRFSVVAGIAPNINNLTDIDVFAAITYHIDGFGLPVIDSFHNIEIGLGPRYNFIKNNLGLILVLRTNF